MPESGRLDVSRRLASLCSNAKPMASLLAQLKCGSTGAAGPGELGRSDAQDCPCF